MMTMFDWMFDCGIHRKLDVLIEGQKETDDTLGEINKTLKEILEKVETRYPNGVAPAAPLCIPEPQGSQPQRSPRIRAAGAGLQAGLNAGSHSLSTSPRREAMPCRHRRKAPSSQGI